jgi:uncharacterized membrane protein YeaQ/YmgE (transglycosylase-associated protein family)
MLHMIGHMVFGLIVGIVAKVLFPGHDPGGIIVTMLLGIVGAWLGGILGQMFGWYQKGQPAGFLMAVVGAIVLLFLYHMMFRHA